MAKLSNVGKWALVGVGVVVVIVLAFMFGGKQNQAPAADNSGVTASSTPGATASSTQNPTSSTTGTGVGVTVGTPHPVRPPAIVIHFITPVVNDRWIFGKQNPIVWDREGGVTAEIDLLDANTMATVGVITSETGPHQTSYTWDTRQIYLARYNPLKKDIVPGTYLIQIKFDGNGLSSITSPAFTVTQ